MENNMKFSMTYKDSVDGGYIGIIKEVPGAASQGETLEELELNLTDALNCMLEANRRSEMSLILGESAKTQMLNIAS